MTTSPTARMIADAIEASGKTQREIAEEMGLLRPNVISMLKSGEMTMPIERIPAFSKATGIDVYGVAKQLHEAIKWNSETKTKKKVDVKLSKHPLSG